MHSRKIAWKFVSGCVFAGMFASGAARAEDSGFYIGASVGQATQKSGEFDGSDMSYKLLVGYSFNKYFAAEGGYVNGGTQEDSLGPIDAEVKSDGFLVAAIGKLPIGEYFVPYAKLGYVVYDATTTLSNGPNQISDSESQEDLLYGVGCEFKIGENFRLRAEWEEVDVPDADFRIISVAATFQF